MLVISLKDSFYSMADSLVGVYNDRAGETGSKVLTLDLSEYALSRRLSGREGAPHDPSEMAAAVRAAAAPVPSAGSEGENGDVEEDSGRGAADAFDDVDGDDDAPTPVVTKQPPRRKRGRAARDE